mgnify:FL=1
MKKRNIFFLITVIVVSAVFIFPTITQRFGIEQKNKVYTLCINLDSVSESFGKADIKDIIHRYAESGFNAALVTDSGAVLPQFDTVSVNAARSEGLDIALCIYANDNISKEYISTLKSKIKDTDAKYIMIKSNPENKNFRLTSDIQKRLFNVIKETGITAVFAENKNQIGNEMPTDAYEYFKSSDGKVLRSYETREVTDCTDKEYDRTYFEMLNSIRERNTKFLSVNQLKDTENTEYNAERTIRSAKRFKAKMSSLGYTPYENSDINGYTPNTNKTTAASVFTAVMMCLYILNSFIKKQNIYIDFLFFFGAAGAACACVFIMPDSLIALCPTAYAVVMPCFCITFIFNLTEKLKSVVSDSMLYAAVFALSAAITMLCALPLAAMLSGWNYYLGESSFRGVKLALMFPAVYGGIYSCFVCKNKFNIKNIKNMSLRHMLIFAAFVCIILACAFIYLKRSGDSSISQFEIKLRNLMADIFPVRPRTKDFLIAWPCLMLTVFCAKNNVSKNLTLLFSIGASVLFASITNSFCHSFTDISIIYTRVAYGAELGIITSLICLFAAEIIQKYTSRKQ